MVQVYVPLHKPVAFAVPCPPPGAGDQLYVYPGVPPDATTEAVPLHPPLQLTFVCDCVAVTAVG